MTDIAMLDIKVANLEEKCEETRGTVRGLEDECSQLSDRTHALELWRNGNGARGAETRLQSVEADMTDVRKCIENGASDDTISKIASAAAMAIVNKARDKDRTTVAKIRAAGPIIAGVAAVLTAFSALVAVLAR
jgi:hypothetical protein